MHIKFSDFGSAKFCPLSKLSGNRRGTLVGTQNYVAPEILLTQESDTSADLWSLGCVAYEMFAGRPPFKSECDNSTFEKILWGDYTFPKDFPELAKDLCSKLIILEKDKRLGAGSDGFKKLKEHIFFAGIDFDNLHRDSVVNGIYRDSSIVIQPIKSNNELLYGENYAVISPKNGYEINYNYFDIDSPFIIKKQTRKYTVNSFNILKEGIVSKKGNLKFYQEVNLILTNEPRLAYYSLDNIYMVTKFGKHRAIYNYGGQLRP